MALRVRAVRLLAVVTMVVVSALGLAAWTAPAASAHVVPTSTIRLDVGEASVAAAVSIPVSDVEAATGIDLGDQTKAAVSRNSAAIQSYLLAHFKPTSDDGRPWSVSVGELTVATTGDPTTTGHYQELEAGFSLVPPDGSNPRSYGLGYDAIVDQVATHVAIVTVGSDWANPDFAGTYQVGVIERDTVTGNVQTLHLALGDGSRYRGFSSMVSLGMEHIKDGTDHQLFLLTLILPAPLLARARRWSSPVPAKSAVRRIGKITLAFTLGHSLTLALGALGFPVPQGVVEAMIAVSILVAAVHAIRPLFPGREALVAATFGLVHGLAFSTTLYELNLTGARLALSLLGFNLGIEVMQLIVVALVLPPLMVLARSGRYRPFRIAAAAATALAAAGWLGARVGIPNPIADLADQLGLIALPVVVILWLVTVLMAPGRRRRTLGTRER